MFKKIKQIDDNVFEYTPTESGVVYVSHKIGENKYKITNVRNGQVYSDEPGISLGRIIEFGNKIRVGKLGGGSYVYNNKLVIEEELDFHYWEKSNPCSLFMMADREIVIMGFANNITKKIQWKLDYCSMQYYIGKNTFYAVKNVESKNNHVYAYDLKTGEEKWLYVIEQEELYGQVKFYAEHNGQIFIAHKEKLHAHDCETGELLSSTSTYYGQIYYEKDVPHILSFFSKFNLETLEEILFDFKPLLVPYWGDYQQTTYIDCLVEGNILIGTHESLVTTNSPEEAAFHLLLIDPDKNEVVWSHEFPYKGLSNYKEARYENGKLYFLDKDGCLTIFEKET